MTFGNWIKRYIVFLHAHLGPVLALSGALALLTACGGDSGPNPTLVPTLALPTPAAPSDAHPTPTSRAAPTLQATRTAALPTDERTQSITEQPTQPKVEPTVQTPIPPCDADTLTAYEDFVARLQGIYTALAGQDYTQDALLAALPQMEHLLTQAQELPIPCSRAYWLRLTLSERIAAEITDLETFADNPKQGDPGAAVGMSPLIADALAALRDEVKAALTPAAPTATPTPAPFLCDCSGDLYDCDYFRSHAEAQSCYDYCLPRAGDVHDLDTDGDGVICPSLP